jgi:hypothetical protein
MPEPLPRVLRSRLWRNSSERLEIASARSELVLLDTNTPTQTQKHRNTDTLTPTQRHAKPSPQTHTQTIKTHMHMHARQHCSPQTVTRPEARRINNPTTSTKDNNHNPKTTPLARTTPTAMPFNNIEERQAHQQHGQGTRPANRFDQRVSRSDNELYMRQQGPLATSPA